ncbi:MAG TPA: formate hydrogenlyase maturation protein HycH [Anaerolineales bacterium]|nr:formate hydrogenlyase maturation protein HycH [Anaerolineales bacterium]
MERQVAFYRLSRKVVNNQDAIPEDARQVMYYSLAIGHHVGVMDCLSELMTVPAEAYQRYLERLPEGEARRKLEGALTWDEIEINRSHVDELLKALQIIPPAAQGVDAAWVKTLMQCLQEVIAEPALYLMVKMRE